MKRKFRVDKGCTLCATCAPECPVSAISFSPTGAVIDEDVCVGCGTCYDNCASEAISEIIIEN